MSDPPPDARESALDLLIRWADTCYDPNGVRIYEDAEIDRARAELSALRASQGAVAREKAALADDIRARIARFGDVDACYCNYWLGRYDAAIARAEGRKGT